MASVGSSQYLSHIFENTRQIVNKPEWTPGDLNDLQMYIKSWDGIQRAQEEILAKESGIPYFFVYTFNRGLYNILTSFFSRPYTNRPPFMNKIASILNILSKINNEWEKILEILRSTGGRAASKTQQETVSTLFENIFKIIDNENLAVIFRALFDEVKGINLSDIQNLSDSQAKFNNIPFDTTKNTIGIHIRWIDNIVKAWYEFAKERQQLMQSKGAENAFQSWMTDPSVHFETTALINNYYLYGENYNPEHILEWQGPTATAAKGELNANQWNTHLDPMVDQVVLIPQQVLGKDYYNFSPDMKLLIIAILQVSDWSIRTGAYVDDALVNTGENEEMRKVREQQRDVDQLKLQFKNDLRRYFLSIKNHEKFPNVQYENTGEQRDMIHSPLGLQKMVKRMTLLKQGEKKIALARRSTNTWNGEWQLVAGIVSRMDDRVATTGGKRRRKRKTRHKKKTKRRKKTRRKRRTKRRKKTRKSKKKRRTKRRRRK
tara:strand:+ start:570 stop:2036 length:1467 start_codon:yes stop_codon:yes gene_type:complete